MIPNNGRHLSFPFRIGKDGRAVQVSTLEEHVRDEIIQLLLTNPGERLFQPEFGGGVRRLVFEPADEATTGAMAKALITRNITRWLGHRVTLEALEVSVENTTIEVEIVYRIAGTEDKRVLRFQRTGGERF
jgi:Bacteriophage baseplate protein W